jgi:5'-nucleotidase
VRIRRLSFIALSTITTASLLAACSSSGSGGSPSSTSSAAASSTAAGTTSPAAATASAAPAVLHIVVTNDDGYSADGISAVVTALAKLPDTEVTVVAPKTNQSGAGGKATDGKLVVTTVQTKDGTAANAVAGTPADTIRAAIDDLGLKPDLVVSGINQGQNLGPAVDLSGTVGAARAAVANGIPGLAVSQGLGSTVNYAAAVPFVTEWVQQNRDGLINKTAPVQVVSINVPSCPTGSVRGIVKVDADLTKSDLGKAMSGVNCASTAAAGKDDVSAFNVGYATESVLAAKPAA